MKFQLVRFINLVLLVCLLVLALTGVYGLFWTLAGWPFDLHRIAGWVLIAVLPWKSIVSWRSLKRGLRLDFDRGVMVFVSLLLAATSLVVLGLGIAWLWRLAPAQLWLRQTAISWHWMLGLGLLGPLALHVWRRWPRPRQIDFTSRRGMLRLIGLVTAGLAAWWAAEALAGSRQLPGAPRRFTGSRLDGLFSGNRFPVTHNLAAEPVAVTNWRLSLAGEVASPQSFSYEALLNLPAASRVATLDCTLGWYTTQTWRGVLLRDLFALAGAPAKAQAVRFESVTGSAQLLPWEEAGAVLLATHVGGETLVHDHGFPLRAVVPSRRGWFWVKWLSRIEVIRI